jgi:hypothetical protein
MIQFFRISLMLFFLAIYIGVQGQGTIVPFGNDAYHIMDRLEIKSGILTPFHSSLKYYLRRDVAEYAMRLDTTFDDLSILDVKDLNYIFRDNNEWLGLTEFPTTLIGPKAGEESIAKMSQTEKKYFAREKPILKYFYRTPANFYEAHTKHFFLKISPMIDFKLAQDSGDSELVFLNRRGVEVRGGIDDRIFFYSNIVESQARFPKYVNRRVNQDQAIPGQGFFKTYKSIIFDITNGYDYLNSESYLGFNVTKHVGVQLGYGKNKIGEGERSLLLSDFANNYLYLKFNTRVWKFHYQNIFAELSPVSTIGNVSGDPLLPKKYMAAHYLNFNITSKMTIGFYEAVMFNRNNNFEFQYLNPLVFYRTVEGAIGSPDNVLLGMNGKWNLFKRFQLYGQVMLDELKFNELFVERRGWWANKLGVQAGLKYIDVFGIDHLDAQVEYNIVRPYTYSHRDSAASYSHFNQPLAHPLGANFKEAIIKLRYQPFHKLVFDGRFLAMNYGEDTATENWGKSVLLSYQSRVQDFGNEIGQGVGTNTIIIGLDASYQIYHNMYLDAHFFYRKMDSENDALDNTTNYIGGGFRMNIGKTRMDF